MGYKVGDEVIAKVRISEVYERNNYPYEVVNISHRNKARSIALRESDIIQKPGMTAEEAWEIAKNLFANYSNAELDDIFEKGWSFSKLMELTPQEAKAKIDAWKAEKAIKVGDIIMNEGLKCVVTRVVQDRIYTVSKIGATPTYCGEHIKKLKKIGHHEGIEGLLNQIGGDE